MISTDLSFGPTSCAPDEMIKLNTKNYCVVAYNTTDQKHRCFGFFRYLKDARNALLSEWRTMEECYYDSFFIEEIEEGLFVASKIVEYYDIDEDRRQLVSNKIPSHFERIINWSIG